ncbi:MAG: hypothetical protein M3Y58_17795 [Chloroflexota bacterium]|nr:hypothetical protein [Chloroflexota bacterium]
MKPGLTQHADGDLYAIERNDAQVITAIWGPLTPREAGEWFVKPTPLIYDPEGVDWAREQQWHVPTEVAMAPIRAAAQKKNRQPDIRAKMVVCGVLIAIVVGGIALWQYAVSQDPRLNGTATATPTGSYAYRTIPINQLTGADWMTMSFDERGQVIATATQRIHCPSAVTSNDLNIAITQAANTAAGRPQKVIDLLSLLFGLDGCVVG